MPLSKSEIETFARSAMREQKARPSEARSLYLYVLKEIRESGYRATRRVREIVWAKLEQIEASR